MALSLFGYMAFMAATLGFALNFDPEMAGASEGMAAPDARDIATSVYTLAPAFGYVFPLIVGAISVTAEFRHQTITPTLLAEPRRSTVMGAKLISALPVGLVIGLRSEEHTSELQSRGHLVCRLLLEKIKTCKR